ncbi:DUF3164 family protein [Providencia alcalifaciens]|uniref:DUF3164 family protein n=1 Tax=Providencia alcalifaciens TaxID=126385 RepID=UPI000D9EC3F9|nr:DUF3164 family protein [Providencia rettgeri]SPZ22748.1 Protein of uncharacterised function (DUF3164) [Providencia rettgeri]
MNVKKEQGKSIPEGYWMDAKGRLVPESMIKEIDKERDQLVSEVASMAIALNTQLTQFKSRSFADIQAFIDLSSEKYGANLGGSKGNVTLYSYDGRFKIQRAMQDRIAFDERFQAAKQLIDACLMDWTEGARPEVHAIITQAFSTDKEGEINPARVLALRRLEIDDERWNKAMNAISEALQVIGSKSYIRVYERIGDTDQYKQIALDISAA